jgi:hypothetical protein
MSFACGDVRNHIVSQKKRPRTFVSAPWGLAEKERSKNQLSREFWHRSIFDFCNNICQEETHALSNDINS